MAGGDSPPAYDNDQEYRNVKEALAEAIFRKWGLDFAVVGETTDDLRFRVVSRGKIEADLPIKDLGTNTQYR